MADASAPTIGIDAIVAAATALTARDGLGALTMRAVATEVGCATMALYRHVSDRDELVARVVDAVCVLDELAPFSPIDAGPDDTGPDDTGPDDTDPRSTADAVAGWLGAATAAMRRRLLVHPGVADHLLLRGPVGPHGMAFMNEVCGAIAALGLSPRQVAVGYDLLMSTVATSVIKQLQLAALGATGPIAGNDFSRRAAEYAAKLPHLRSVIGEFGSDSDDAFARRIGGLIDALVMPGNPLLARHR